MAGMTSEIQMSYLLSLFSILSLYKRQFKKMDKNCKIYVRDMQIIFIWDFRSSLSGSNQSVLSTSHFQKFT